MVTVANARCCLCAPLKQLLGYPDIGAIRDFTTGLKCDICYHPMCDNCKLPGFNDFEMQNLYGARQPQYLSSMPSLPPTTDTRTVSSTTSTRAPYPPSSSQGGASTQIPNPPPSSRHGSTVTSTQMLNPLPSSRRISTVTGTQTPRQSASSSSRQKSSTKVPQPPSISQDRASTQIPKAPPSSRHSTTATRTQMPQSPSSSSRTKPTSGCQNSVRTGHIAKNLKTRLNAINTTCWIMVFLRRSQERENHLKQDLRH